MSAFSVMPLMSLLDSLGHRQLLRMLHPDVGSQHSEDAAQEVLHHAVGVLLVIQASPGPAGSAQHLQRFLLVLQEAQAQPPAVQQPMQPLASQQKSPRPPLMSGGSSSRKCKLRLPACKG
jgi:hypothetical protein